MPASQVTAVTPRQYVFSFPQPATGAVQVAWASGHGIVDQAATPNNFGGGSWTYRLDPNAGTSQPYISEFMASNTRTLADESGLFPDWIEIYNPGTLPVNLDGWSLTDSAANLQKWRFPATNLAGGSFLVVFASGNDRRVPGARLHTSFQLSSDGEYLALVKPDGVTVASEFSPVFPPQAPDVSYGFPQTVGANGLDIGPGPVFFTTPTPGAANQGGAVRPGPILDQVGHTPNVPKDDEDLLVTARVRPTFAAVASVTMRYRIMFSNEVSTPMFDDGQHGDGAAGDGIYGATIPANLSTNGQMIRYAVTATDAAANTSRWPLFTSPLATEEYLGTIVDPTNVTSKLPIFHLFVGPTQIAGIDTESGGRLSVFYDGELYDNIYMELRGNTSASYNKKSHRLEFNRNHEFRHPGPGGRVRKSSLLAEYVDPAYLRQHLSFWLLDKIGVPSPFDYPVRVQMNGQFYSLAFHNDVIGQEQVERLGYDPRGALYKAVGTAEPSFYSTGSFQKLEPDNDTSRTDYLSLVNGINNASAIEVRRATVFDQMDVPEVINYLAGARWTSENDDVWANMSIYRDTFGDQLWRIIPFDMNASWGQLYGGSSPLEATVDTSKSHPLYGGGTTGSPYNRIYDVIVALPETRQMLLRRERSVLDGWILPPGTPASSLILENYIKQMTNLIVVEANLDRAKWGFAPWAPGKTFSDGSGDLLNQFVALRRTHWYVTHSITNTSRPIGINQSSNAGIPTAQPPNAFIGVVGVEFNPSSGNQDEEYVALGNPAPFAVDISGWKLDGAVSFTFRPGTVVPSNSVIYVSPNVRAFRARATGPRGGQGLFVVGPSKGQLSARGETIRVLNTLDQAVNTYTYLGQPSQAQQYLRITELMYHPSAHPANT
ncbi:MAG TPA: CotH kinase family protein, partial [Candidatus Saccharimonadales bacterium]|nr:CotH kinase family protein [Candidatus Saccharimonadales bacterium]